jgi:uncharacterized protein (DUF4415 family)
MKKQFTKISSAKRIVIDGKIRVIYAERDRVLDKDPDAPTLPPEMWNNATIGKYYRPKKTPVAFRADSDVLAWLKSKGTGHLSRINEILRQQMQADLRK